MKCQVLLLLGILISNVSSLELQSPGEGIEETVIEGYILCKNCGEDTTVLNLIDNSRVSSSNRGLSNFTFGSKEILLQDLRNPRGINFKVLVTKRASCAKTSGWFSESSWFEGYAWKVCLCPSCKAHIGWMFEPIDLAAFNPLYPGSEGFYAIILDTVISESYANSLLIVDKILRN